MKRWNSSPPASAASTPSLILLLARLAAAANVTNQLQYVDPLIGSANGGNVFAGASLPYGLAKAVADTNSGSNQGGFTADGSDITGFSSLHDSGTGGSPSLGDFALFPYASCVNDTIDGCDFPKISRATPYVSSSVVATPGYFSIELASGVSGEMTTTAHTSLFQFTFPSGADTVQGGADSPLILMDLTDLSDSRQDNGTIAVDPSTGRITGNAVFLPSFGSGSYVPYFCADFKGPSLRDTGIFVNSRAGSNVENLTISRSINGYPLPGGAWVRFKTNEPVLARVGLSFISSDHACSAAESEIPNFDFNATRSAAVNAWQKQMSPISVSTTGVNSTFLTNFYSGVYRTYINPQNYTGFTSLVASDQPYWDSFYCIWDLFRSQNPFLIVTDPVAVVEQVKGLLNIYQIQGWLPDCHMSLNKGYTQGGSNADNILADLFQKLNGTSSIDWQTAYAAVKKDAEEEPYDWCCQGRGGLDSWKSLGYIPVQDFDYKGFGTMTRSISRTLEYAYNDFCISRIAAGLNNIGDKETYEASSENWENLYKSDQTSYLLNSTTNTGFVGFFQPKFLNQTWGFQDPLKCSNIDTDPNSVCSLQNDGAETFESSIWEYSFFVPHDQAKLISTFGGPSLFVQRLNYLHDEQITYIGNEPAFLTVFQYHYAGRPALSALRSHYYIPAYFAPTPAGLPGNDDSGAMGSFVAFAMLGLFPNPGQNVYLITPPYFESVSVTNPSTGKTARIRNVGFDPSYRNVYIQSATLNGKNYTKNWISHDFFTEGMELVLTLGRNESSWGTRVQDLPPSLSPYEGYS